MRRFTALLLAGIAFVAKATPVNFVWDGISDPHLVGYEMGIGPASGQYQQFQFQPGIGTTITLDLPPSPPSFVSVRTIGEENGQRIESTWSNEIMWSENAKHTGPTSQIGFWGRYHSTDPVSGPSFGELGTLDYRGNSASSSLTSTLGNVAVGDLLVAVVQRDNQAACTGVAIAVLGIGFVKIATATSGSGGFNTDLWGAIATQSAGSVTVTASYSSSASWGSLFTARYSAGVTSLTPVRSTAHNSLQPASTIRTNADFTTTVKTLMIAFGTDWDYYAEKSASVGWTKRVDSDVFGTASTTQFLLDRVADAGIYPAGPYAVSAGVDQYMSGIVALPVSP